MDTRFDGKRALVTGAGKGMYLRIQQETILCFLLFKITYELKLCHISLAIFYHVYDLNKTSGRVMP